MVLDAVSNFVRGESDAAIDDTQTTVSVVDASIFPDPATDGEYNVVIWDAQDHPRPDQDPDVEILRVTAIDTGTNDLTVTRAQETTTAASHPSGSAIHLSPTAKMFGDIEDTFADFWDAGAQELTADVNNGSVNTEQATIRNPTDGATNSFVRADQSSASDAHAAFAGFEKQNDVSTSAVTIWDMNLIADSGTIIGGGLITVSGRQQGAAARFSDVVHIYRNGDPVVVNSIENDSPAGRTYTRSSTDIQLAMGSDTYNVLAIGSYGWANA